MASDSLFIPSRFLPAILPGSTESAEVVMTVKIRIKTVITCICRTDIFIIATPRSSPWYEEIEPANDEVDSNLYAF